MDSLNYDEFESVPPDKTLRGDLDWGTPYEPIGDPQAYVTEKGKLYLQNESIGIRIKKINNNVDPLKIGSTIAPMGQIANIVKYMPPPHFLIPGVKDTSFGFVYGPTKSGKT